MSPAHKEEDAGLVPYCSVCRRSSECKWRKHVFTKAHQRGASAFLARCVERLQKIREDLARVLDANGPGQKPEPAPNMYCAFCELAIAPRNWTDVVEHFGSDTHSERVDVFCKHHRCDPDRDLRRHRLCLSAAEHQQIMKRLQAEDASLDGVGIVNAGSNLAAGTSSSKSNHSHVDAFLSSATARLQEVSERRGATATSDPAVSGVNEPPVPSLMGPPRHTLSVRTRMVTSVHGIQQHPLGRYDGRRVWGGGIVKVRKSEWIPWGIDLLVQADEQQAGAISSRDGRNSDSNSNNGDDNDNGGLRITELAFGDGLSSIRRVEWGDHVANVHSSAVPPWMVQSEAEYKNYNERPSIQNPVTNSPHPVESRVVARGKDTHFEKAAKPKSRDIFTRLKPEYDEKTWLPNFGGVWQQGSRATTKHEFQKKTREKISRTSRPPRHISSQSTNFRRPAISCLTPQQPSTRCQVLANAGATQSQSTKQVIAQPTPAAVGPTTPPVTALLSELDAKKQRLIAQKERLRAKLAAKPKK